MKSSAVHQWPSRLISEGEAEGSGGIPSGDDASMLTARIQVPRGDQQGSGSSCVWLGLHLHLHPHLSLYRGGRCGLNPCPHLHYS